MKTALRTCALVLTLVLAAPLAAQDFCVPCERIVNRIVYDQQPYKAYRYEYETVIEQRQVTTQRPVYETEMRTRRYRVAKPVVETAEREERYYTLKPVYETEERTREYDQTTWETITEMRQDRFLVNRPVVETQMQERQHVVRRPVQETVWQDQAYTQMTPVTTMRTQLVDQGGFVDSVNYVPGTSHCHLGWMPRGASTNAVTGETYYRRGGLAWVPRTTPGTYAVSRAYVPNIVAQQVPVTSMMPQTVVQKVPLAVTRYHDEVVSEQVPVQVQRIEQVEEVRETPVTYQRPKTERIVEKIPVQTVRYEREEQVRKVPYEVHRMEYEDVEEPYEVKVVRWETETQTIEVPVQQRKLVEYTAYRLVPRVVTMRLPIDAPVPVIEEGAIIRRESSRIVLPPAGTSRLVPLRKKEGEPSKAKSDANNGEKAGDPADKAPTGEPALNGKGEKKEEGLDLNRPAGGKEEPTPAEKKDGKMA
jgi:hypothetical protein